MAVRQRDAFGEGTDPYGTADPTTTTPGYVPGAPPPDQTVTQPTNPSVGAPAPDPSGGVQPTGSPNQPSSSLFSSAPILSPLGPSPSAAFTSAGATTPSLATVGGNANLAGGGTGSIANPLANLPTPNTTSSTPGVSRRGFAAAGGGDPSTDPNFQGLYASSDDEENRRRGATSQYSPQLVGDQYQKAPDMPALPPGASYDPNHPGQINWTPGSATLAGIQQTPGPDGKTLGQGTGTFRDQNAQPQQAQAGWLQDWPVPQGADAGLWQQIGDAIQKAGGTIGGPGSGPGDIQYYYDTISKAGGWNSHDWAGRIARGVKGTEPSSSNQFTAPGNVGQDPFSQLLTSGWGDIIQNKGQPSTDFGKAVRGSIEGTLSSGGKLPNDASVQQFEKARTQLEAGRRAQLDAAMADLANRGLAPEGKTNGGALVTAEDYINRGLAPSFAQAVEDYQVQQANMQNQLFGQAQNLGAQSVAADQTAYQNALSGGGNFQATQTGLALKQLEDSQQFNEFVANYGLNRDQVLYELQNQQNSQLLQALYQYLITNSQAAGGHI